MNPVTIVSIIVYAIIMLGTLLAADIKFYLAVLGTLHAVMFMIACVSVVNIERKINENQNYK